MTQEFYSGLSRRSFPNHFLPTAYTACTARRINAEVDTRYCGWTMTMDFAMDQCLQWDARQSHSLVADLIVK